MNEAFKRILDEAVMRIEESEKKAHQAAVEAKKDLQDLAEFAESLPHRILDNMAVLTTGEFEFGKWHHFDASLNIGGYVSKLEGGLRSPLVGKYRAIVILQKM